MARETKVARSPSRLSFSFAAHPQKEGNPGFQRLVEALSRPEAYPRPVEEISVVQTHISAVFLAGPCAYKVKKPLDLGFLDFTTLERRRHFCQEEVRLNRRLAPGVYLGVVPITEDGGRLRFGGEGKVVDFAVLMKRLPEERTLRALLERGKLESSILEELGRRLAEFHARGESGERVSRWGRWEVVAGNCRENFDQVAPFVGFTIYGEVLERLRSLTEAELEARRPGIEGRALRGVPRDTHGDLRLKHVYLFPEEPPPGDIIVLDCIEFNERFRHADPVADAAFLAMELEFHGQPDLSRAFLDAYFEAANDAEGRSLLPLYMAYRATVRGKVESLKFGQEEISPAEKSRALQSARAHFLLALKILSRPVERPCLVLVGGLPGTGKSSLARGLEESAGFIRISSDEIRKELAGVAGGRKAAAAFEQGIYTTEWNRRTYAACLERAEDLLFRGRRVVVEATFREEENRRAFLDAARTWGAPGLFFLCEAHPDEVFSRLSRPRRGVSDADWCVYQGLAARWETVGEKTIGTTRRIDTSGPPQETLETALRALRDEGLA